jgi:hypothetical protein
MTNNEEQVVDVNKTPTPFLKKVNELEKKVDAFDDRLTAVENKLNTILQALKTRG